MLSEMATFSLGVNVVRLMGAICGLLVVWQISHKILLICGSLAHHDSLLGVVFHVDG